MDLIGFGGIPLCWYLTNSQGTQCASLCALLGQSDIFLASNQYDYISLVIIKNKQAFPSLECAFIQIKQSNKCLTTLSNSNNGVFLLSRDSFNMNCLSEGGGFLGCIIIACSLCCIYISASHLCLGVFIITIIIILL